MAFIDFIMEEEYKEEQEHVEEALPERELDEETKMFKIVRCHAALSPSNRFRSLICNGKWDQTRLAR